MPKVTQTNIVFNWPEFIAFATRLGIDLDQPIRRLVIELEMLREVIISQEFLGVDTKEGEEDASSN